MIKPRPVQQLVPAGDAATGRSPDAGQRLIPADRDCGTSEPLESPSEVEARVASLEAEYRRWKEVYLTAPLYGRESRNAWLAMSVLLALIEEERSGEATGGNAEICRREPEPGQKEDK